MIKKFKLAIRRTATKTNGGEHHLANRTNFVEQQAISFVELCQYKTNSMKIGRIPIDWSSVVCNFQALLKAIDRLSSMR